MRQSIAIVCLISGFLVPVFEEDAHSTYSQLKAFSVAAAPARAANVVLKRDRVEMHFDGAFYAGKPVEGKVRGAVFLGIGSVMVEPPDAEYERDNLRRMIRAERIDTDFKTAVLRFSDDTWAKLGLKETAGGAASGQAMKLARELALRLLKDAGLNPDARIAVAILNRELPGVFLAQFDGGKLGRFVVAIDRQGRIPCKFGFNAGEQGIVFARHGPLEGTDVWQAFASRASIAQHRPLTSERFNLIRVRHYAIKVDLREVKADRMSVEATINADALQDGVRAIPFTLNEGLYEDRFTDERLKKALRCEWVKAADGTALQYAQEGWEAGLSVFLPNPLARGSRTSLTIRVSGESILHTDNLGFQRRGYASTKGEEGFFPRARRNWYPNYGFAHATYDLVFLHRSGLRIISIGVPYEVTGATAKGEEASGWKMEKPVSAATFVGGTFDRDVRPGQGKVPTVEYNSLSGFLSKTSVHFWLTELSNGADYYSQWFGPCPFQQIDSVMYPRPYGLSVPSLIFLPPYAMTLGQYELPPIARAVAHQWWGRVGGWKSYRDRWLSEGFAEYSAALYVKVRGYAREQLLLIRAMRAELSVPLAKVNGVAARNVGELAPMNHSLLVWRNGYHAPMGALGQGVYENYYRAEFDVPGRWSAYYALTYSKGALVLRMLHFLLTDPESGDDSAFYAMMKDFATRFAGRAASTEDFFAVASEHFRRAPLGIKYNLQNLDWFYRQWVLETVLPSYRLEYSIQPQQNGVLLNGVVYQTGTPDDWFMPLPLVIDIGKDQEARGTVQAQGAQSNFSIPLPAAPTSVTLDPDLYILSEKTETGR